MSIITRIIIILTIPSLLSVCLALVFQGLGCSALLVASFSTAQQVHYYPHDEDDNYDDDHDDNGDNYANNNARCKLFLEPLQCIGGYIKLGMTLNNTGCTWYRPDRQPSGENPALNCLKISIILLFGSFPSYFVRPRCKVLCPVSSPQPSLWATLLDRPSPESFMQPLGSATTVSSYRQLLTNMTLK